MPSLIDLRRRIRAVKNTQQITKAMKMVAASRLRRAHERVLKARPMAEMILRVMESVAGRVDPTTHPLLSVRDETAPGAKTLLIVVAGDKGLAGSFNSNIVKAAGGFIVGRPGQGISLGLVGRKARDAFARRGFPIRFDRINLFARLDYTDAQAIAKTAIADFTKGDVAAVYIVYNEFKSIIQQRVAVERLLPIPRLGERLAAAAARADRGAANVDVDKDGRIDEGSAVDYLYEPSPQQIFDELLPRHVEVGIWHALLESAAAEHAARMTAMDAATKNSAEMIESLTLYMNKVRQASITREIIEVVSGAQAL